MRDDGRVGQEEVRSCGGRREKRRAKVWNGEEEAESGWLSDCPRDQTMQGNVWDGKAAQSRCMEGDTRYKQNDFANMTIVFVYDM